MIAQRIQESLRFWWQNLPALLLVTVPFAIAGELVQWGVGPALYMDEDALRIGHLSALLLMLLRPFSEGAVMAQLVAIQNGRARGLGDCLLFCLRAAPVLLLTYLLLGIAVYAGMLLLIFPGVWLYARLCQAPFIAVLENVTPVQALQASFQRSQQDQWQIMLAVVMVFMLILLVSNTLAIVLIALLGENQGSGLLVSIGTTLISSLMSVIVFRYYGLLLPARRPE